MNRLLDIFPAKMGLFRIGRELQFCHCNHDKPCADPYMTREGECFYTEKEVGRAVVNKVHGFSLTESCQEKRKVILVPVELCYHSWTWELPLLVSLIYLTEVLVY